MPVDGPAYPVNLQLVGRPCLVVGAGRVAAQKVDGLLECGAEVHVIAVSVGPAVQAHVDAGDITIERREYQSGAGAGHPGDAAGYRLVIAATDDPAVNRAVYLDGEAAGVWVNSADDPANCAFTLPARVRQGPLLVTFSTGGRSPALATWLRRRFTEEIGPDYLTLLDLLASERSQRQAAGQPTEGLDWQRALDSGMLDRIRTGRVAEAKDLLRACLSSSSD